jgi:hypothetical protein
MTLSRFVLVVAIVSVLASCAGAPPSAGVKGERSPETSAAGPQRSGGKVERPATTGAGLEAAAFSGLPEGVKAYLERLAEAVRARDGGFLLAQGERNYAARVRGTVDDAFYFALLYRVGPYAVEKPDDDEHPPRLNPSRLRAIRYTGWDDHGPVADIRGLLTLSDGAPLPCRISVLWKLREPRILGQEP